MVLTYPTRGTVSLRAPVLSEGEGGHAVVCLQGEHDAFTVDSLSEAIARAVEVGDGDLVVDLSGVDFMGVATVGVILRTQALLRLQSRSVVVRSPSSCAKRIINLCGLAGLIHSAETHGATTAVGGGP